MGAATIVAAAAIGTAGGKFTAVRSLLSAAPPRVATIAPDMGITIAGARLGGLAVDS